MSDDVDSEVYRLSARAFALAKEAASGGRSLLEEDARRIDERLDELWEQLQAAPSSDPGVTRAWSDARLDVGYVLSGGELSPSPRLAQHLAESG